jgi:hypothetical protein
MAFLDCIVKMGLLEQRRRIVDPGTGTLGRIVAERGCLVTCLALAERL